MNGPVVRAAREALEKGNVNLVLPWAPKDAEAEIKNAFKRTLAARKLGKDAEDVAYVWFFETVVRLHRTGEGAPYTGLKPAGLDEGPVVPRAEKALEDGDPKEVILFIEHAVAERLQKMFSDAMSKKKHDANDVDAAREYVEAMLGFILFSHKLYMQITSGEAHEKEEGAGHKH